MSDRHLFPATGASVAERVCAWAESDSVDGCRIYDELNAAYLATLTSFDGDISLFKVYFYDILKLLTNSYYKSKELDSGVQPKESNLLAPLTGYPYLGYMDIINGFNPQEKKFGKSIAFHQGGVCRLSYIFMRVKTSLVRTNYGMPTLLVTSSTIDRGCNILLDAPNSVKLLQASDQWFALPDLDEQIKLITSAIYSVMSVCKHPLSPASVAELISRHILANTRTGYSSIKLDGDVVVLKSGIELKNRMIGSVARQRGLKVVNVMHGEAFGLYDEPLFSTLGEIAYSDIILGYGRGGVESSVPYEWGMEKGTKYIGSNGVQVGKIFKRHYTGVSAVRIGPKYYYFPTTFSGSSHRYGPFRDIPDSVYMEWQLELSRLFGDDMVFKGHPKEKYYLANPIVGVKSAVGSLESLADNIDVFIFDHIGTAFNIACATGKPVIYFDIGLRNIHSEAMASINERVIYIDVKQGVPSKKEIDAMVRFGVRENTFTQKYSLGGRGLRTHSLLAELTG